MTLVLTLAVHVICLLSLSSQYNMILNLLRVEEMSVEAMIKRSFSEFATQRELAAKDVPRLLARGRRTLAKLEEQLENENSTRVGAEDIETYFEVCKHLLSINQQVVDYIRETELAAFQDIFNVGRLVLVTAARKYGVVRAPALVLKAPQAVEASRFGATTSQTTTPTAKKMICMVLMPSGYEPEDASSIGKDGPGEIDDFGTSRHRYFAIREIDLDQVVLTTTRKRKIDVKTILKDSVGGGRSRGHPGLDSGVFAVDSSFAGMKALGKRGDDSLGGCGFGGGSAPSAAGKDKAVDYLLELENDELRQDGGDGSPVLDLRQFLQRGSDALYFRSVCDQMDDLLAQMRSLASHKHPNLEKYYAAVERKDILRTKVDTLQHALSNESLNLFPDFLQRKEVLRRLNYVDDNEAVCVKGRVACEVNTCEELIATEMVFEGLLNDLQPEEIVAVLSSLVFQEKKDECELDDDLPGSLLQCCDKLKAIATNLGQLQRDCGLEVDPNEYCENSLKFGLVHVVYEWALGVSFKDICALTDVQEGSIVRCITRLDELCREIRNCARVVGNPSLYRKCESASAAIKRDIVFASSLYVS
jgi:antiviral helicase SKI2